MSAAPEQPPRAADVPEAVREAIRASWYAAHQCGANAQRNTHSKRGESEHQCTVLYEALYAAIATALREARDQGAAQLDIARDGRRNDPIIDNPKATRYMLLLVLSEQEADALRIADVSAWTPQQRLQAEKWAAAVHAHASDHIVPRSKRVPPSHITELRRTLTARAAEPPVTREDGR